MTPSLFLVRFRVRARAADERDHFSIVVFLWVFLMRLGASSDGGRQHKNPNREENKEKSVKRKTNVRR